MGDFINLSVVSHNWEKKLNFFLQLLKISKKNNGFNQETWSLETKELSDQYLEIEISLRLS